MLHIFWLHFSISALKILGIAKAIPAFFALILENAPQNLKQQFNLIWYFFQKHSSSGSRDASHFRDGGIPKYNINIKNALPIS